MSTAFRDFLRREVHLPLKLGEHMNVGWIILGICVILVLGAALPLIRPRNDVPPPPPKETLRDWRNEK